MKNLREYLEEQINENLIQAVLSAGRNKDGISKIKIRPIRLKGQICYQASATEGQKVLHKNYGRTELIEYVEKELAENFRQFQAQGAVTDGVVLVSKKGKMTIKQKHHEQKEEQELFRRETAFPYHCIAYNLIENRNNKQCQYSRHNQSANNYGSQRTLYFGTG